MGSNVAEADEKKAGKRLTPKQWGEIEALWEAGDVTLDDLAKRYGKPRSTFSRHFDKHKIVKGSAADENKTAVKEEVKKVAIDEATVLAGRIRETKEEHYKMAAGIAKLTWGEILKAKQDGQPVAVAMNNLKALESAMNVLTKARNERWAVLGLDKESYVDEEGLPELLISELTAEQIEEMRNRDESDIDYDISKITQGGEEQFSGEDDDVVEEGGE